MITASLAALVQVHAPLVLSQRVTVSTLSMLMLASSAVLAQMLAPLKLPSRNNRLALR